MEYTVNTKGDEFFKKVKDGQKKSMFAYIPFVAYLIIMGLAGLNFQFNFFVIVVPVLFATYYMIYIPTIGAKLVSESVYSFVITKDSIEIITYGLFFFRSKKHSIKLEDLSFKEATRLNKYYKIDPTYLLADEKYAVTFYFYPTFFIENTEIDKLVESIGSMQIRY